MQHTPFLFKYDKRQNSMLVKCKLTGRLMPVSATKSAVFFRNAADPGKVQ